MVRTPPQYLSSICGGTRPACACVSVMADRKDGEGLLQSLKTARGHGRTVCVLRSNSRDCGHPRRGIFRAQPGRQRNPDDVFDDRHLRLCRGRSEKPMRVALIHYWLLGERGGEKVL